MLGSKREIPLDQPLGELGVGLDSLALVNLLTAVEGAFGVELSDEIWTVRGPLSVNDLADIVRSTPRTSAPTPSVADTPILHGRMEQLEDSLRRRGTAGRAIWFAVRVAAPVKGFLFARSRHHLLERRLDDAISTALAPPPGVELLVLEPGEQQDFSELWAPVHARRSEHVVERALAQGAIALVAREGDRIVALDLVSASGDEEVDVVSPGLCYGFFLTEARAARGRGIGLALAAYSFAVARERGFRRQLTHVWEGNTAMLASATQLLGFRTIGIARRRRVAGVTRWSWTVDRMHGRGPRLVL